VFVMMLYPSMNTLLENISSRYLLVNIVSRRAREIASEAEKQDIRLTEKPVKLAINEIAEGKLYGKLKSED